MNFQGDSAFDKIPQLPRGATGKMPDFQQPKSLVTTMQDFQDVEYMKRE